MLHTIYYNLGIVKQLLIQPKMLTKKQFREQYDECVQDIRFIKDSNDKINKAIGILNQFDVQRQVKNDQPIVQNMLAKILQTVNKMEKAYLDPDTVRKINVLKQQSYLQKDRRNKLINSLNQLIKAHKKSQIAQIKTNEQTPQYSSKSQSLQTQASPLSLQQKQQQLQQSLLANRGAQLKKAHEKLNNLHSLMKETQNIVYWQGQKIDMIEEQIVIATGNVQLVNNELAQANQRKRRAAKKYLLFVLILFAVIGVLILFIFAI